MIYLASVKAKLLEGYYDDINQTKQVKKPTPAQWHKAGMTAPEEEYLPPSARATPTAPKPAQSTPTTPTTPKPSAPKTTGIIPTTTNSITNPVQPTTAPTIMQNNFPRPGEPTVSATETVTEPVVEQGPSIQDLINQMNESIRQSRIAALAKARDAALQNLAEQESAIKPRYYDARNQAAAQSDVGALNFAQYMAGRGIKGAAAGMPEIYRNAALQGNIGALNRQEQAEYDWIARNRAGIQNAYEQDVAAANADIDAQGLQAFINQMNADRAFGLQEAGVTGTYKGTPTLDAQNLKFNQGIAEAGVTGMYNGQPTFAYQQWQSDVDYRNRTFDENVRQFNMNYGLDLKRISLQQAQNAIDAAYKRGQLSLAQARQALDEAEFIERQKQNEWERQQAELKLNQPADISGYMQNALNLRMQGAANTDILGYIGSLPISAQQKADMANALGL
jgi:polyhydroxyalkanoate synthesis regulator phasin